VFVDLGIQHAKRNAPYGHVTCPSVQYFSTPSHKRHEFRKKQKAKQTKLLNTKRLFSFSLQPSSETFLILRITERDIIKNTPMSLSKVSAILVRF
jgi:hypothetical protein